MSVGQLEVGRDRIKKMIIWAALNNHSHTKNHRGLSEGSSDGKEETIQLRGRKGGNGVGRMQEPLHQLRHRILGK